MRARIHHHIRSFGEDAHALGIHGALRRTAYRARTQLRILPPQKLTIRPKTLSYPVVMRGGGSSDMDVFDEIFIRREFEILNDSQPGFVVDLGAYIGLASVWFLSCFPKARVLAIEPDPGNYALCCKNLRHYGDRARVLHGAVWSGRTRLQVTPGVFRDGREWATQVRCSDATASGSTVESWDIATLIKLSGFQTVDLLKVDIEKSELEVFANGCDEWLPLVRNICIELHGADCKEVFFRALEDYEYDLSRFRELTICRNLRRKTLAARAASL